MVIHGLIAVPLALLVWDIAHEIQTPGTGFSGDPGEEIVRRLGEWSLRVLILTLTVSPLSRLSKTPALVRYRRMIGLWAFSYMTLHFTSYIVFLAGLELQTIAEDFIDRPYITAGLTALLLLIPLAATSTRGWQRRLGTAWKKLHRLIFPAAAAAWIHLLWLSKASFLEPVIYGLLLLLVLGERVFRFARRYAPGAA